MLILAGHHAGRHHHRPHSLLHRRLSAGAVARTHAVFHRGRVHVDHHVQPAHHHNLYARLPRGASSSVLLTKAQSTAANGGYASHSAIRRRRLLCSRCIDPDGDEPILLSDPRFSRVFFHCKKGLLINRVKRWLVLDWVSSYSSVFFAASSSPNPVQSGPMLVKFF